MASVTGIGGVFFRSPNPKATMAWYAKHLGVVPQVDHTSSIMKASGGEMLVWSPFEESTDYFGASGQEFMVNYRVDDLDAMLAELREAGVEVADEVQREEYGSFGWAVDCDGRRFELWQAPAGS